MAPAPFGYENNMTTAQNSSSSSGLAKNRYLETLKGNRTEESSPAPVNRTKIVNVQRSLASGIPAGAPPPPPPGPPPQKTFASSPLNNSAPPPPPPPGLPPKTKRGSSRVLDRWNAVASGQSPSADRDLVDESENNDENDDTGTVYTHQQAATTGWSSSPAAKEQQQKSSPATGKMRGSGGSSRIVSRWNAIAAIDDAMDEDGSPNKSTERRGGEVNASSSTTPSSSSKSIPITKRYQSILSQNAPNSQGEKQQPEWVKKRNQLYADTGEGSTSIPSQDTTNNQSQLQQQPQRSPTDVSVSSARSPTASSTAPSSYTSFSSIIINKSDSGDRAGHTNSAEGRIEPSHLTSQNKKWNAKHDIASGTVRNNPFANRNLKKVEGTADDSSSGSKRFQNGNNTATPFGNVVLRKTTPKSSQHSPSPSISKDKSDHDIVTNASNNNPVVSPTGGTTSFSSSNRSNNSRNFHSNKIKSPSWVKDDNGKLKETNVASPVKPSSVATPTSAVSVNNKRLSKGLLANNPFLKQDNDITSPKNMSSSPTKRGVFQYRNSTSNNNADQNNEALRQHPRRGPPNLPSLTIDIDDDEGGEVFEDDKEDEEEELHQVEQPKPKKTWGGNNKFLAKAKMASPSSSSKSPSSITKPFTVKKEQVQPQNQQQPQQNFRNESAISSPPISSTRKEEFDDPPSHVNIDNGEEDASTTSTEDEAPPVHTPTSQIQTLESKNKQWQPKNDIPSGKVSGMVSSLFGGNRSVQPPPPPPPPPGPPPPQNQSNSGNRIRGNDNGSSSTTPRGSFNPGDENQRDTNAGGTDPWILPNTPNGLMFSTDVQSNASRSNDNNIDDWGRAASKSNDTSPSNDPWTGTPDFSSAKKGKKEKDSTNNDVGPSAILEDEDDDTWFQDTSYGAISPQSLEGIASTKAETGKSAEEGTTDQHENDQGNELTSISDESQPTKLLSSEEANDKITVDSHPSLHDPPPLRRVPTHEIHSKPASHDLATPTVENGRGYGERKSSEPVSNSSPAVSNGGDTDVSISVASAATNTSTTHVPPNDTKTSLSRTTDPLPPPTPPPPPTPSYSASAKKAQKDNRNESSEPKKKKSIFKKLFGGGYKKKGDKGNKGSEKSSKKDRKKSQSFKQKEESEGKIHQEETLPKTTTPKEQPNQSEDLNSNQIAVTSSEPARQSEEVPSEQLSKVDGGVALDSTSGEGEEELSSTRQITAKSIDKPDDDSTAISALTDATIIKTDRSPRVAKTANDSTVQLSAASLETSRAVDEDNDNRIVSTPRGEVDPFDVDSPLFADGDPFKKSSVRRDPDPSLKTNVNIFKDHFFKQSQPDKRDLKNESEIDDIQIPTSDEDAPDPELEIMESDDDNEDDKDKNGEDMPIPKSEAPQIVSAENSLSSEKASTQFSERNTSGGSPPVDDTKTPVKNESKTQERAKVGASPHRRFKNRPRGYQSVSKIDGVQKKVESAVTQDDRGEVNAVTSDRSLGETDTVTTTTSTEQIGPAKGRATKLTVSRTRDTTEVGESEENSTHSSLSYMMRKKRQYRMRSMHGAVVGQRKSDDSIGNDPKIENKAKPRTTEIAATPSEGTVSREESSNSTRDRNRELGSMDGRAQRRQQRKMQRAMITSKSQVDAGNEMTDVPMAAKTGSGTVEPETDNSLKTNSSDDSLARGQRLSRMASEASVRSNESAESTKLRSILKKPRLARPVEKKNESVESTNRNPLENQFGVYAEKAVDPVQFAGLRLLSTAVIPIQAMIRGFLAQRTALHRMFGLIIIQAYVRRWLAERSYRRWRASIVVNAYMRRWIAEQQFWRAMEEKDRFVGSVIIQAYWRRWATNRDYQQLRTLKVGSATKIQASFRGWQARDEIEDQHFCAAQIQRIARGHLSKARAQERLIALISIQAYMRRWRAEQLYWDMLEERDRLVATIIIQAYFRRWMAERDFIQTMEEKLRFYSSVILQSHIRCWIDKRNYQELRSVHVGAVTKIQANFRGWSARDMIEDHHYCATQIQRCARCYNARQKAERRFTAVLTIQGYMRRWLIKRELAATVIQAYMRRWIAERDYREALDEKDSFFASIIIQSFVRRSLTQKKYQIMRPLHLGAVTKIQAVFRGWIVRDDIEGQHFCAVEIQRVVRGNLVKVEMRKRADASLTIQTYLRRWIAEMRYLQALAEKYAAITIQAYMRRWAAEQNFWAAMEDKDRSFSAIILQTAVRRWIAMRNFRELRSSILLQTAVRRWIAMQNYQGHRSLYVEAITKIQATYRGWTVRDDIEDQHFCASEIQRVVRSNFARKEAEERFVALVAMQTYMRRWIAERYRARLSKEKDASIVIQAYMRRWMAEQNFWDALESRDKFFASIVIQSFMRRWISERQYHQYRTVNVGAATKLQATYRGWLVRSDVLDQHYCATQIQRVARGHLAIIEERRRFAALLIIQAYTRRWIAERRFINDLREKYASIVIQSHARRYIAVRKYHYALEEKGREIGSIIIQAYMRRWIAERRYWGVLENKERLLGSTIIQAYVRRWIAEQRYRIALQEKYRVVASIIIQAYMRRWITEQRYSEIMDEKDRLLASIIIQANLRRWISERQYQQSRSLHVNSVLSIQSAYRGWLVREELRDQHFCATQIQRITRGYLATMAVYEDIYRVTVVQSYVRMKLATENATYRMAFIIQSQSIIRGFLARRQLKKSKSSAVIIQKKWRGHSIRLNYQFSLLDIILLQSKIRQYLAQVKYEFDLLRIIMVQSCIRRRQACQLAQKKREAKQQQETRAATLIQTQYRCFSTSAKYEFDLFRIIIVQSIFRQKAARLILLQKSNERRHRAATLIQSRYRSHCTSLNYEFDLIRIIIVQSYFRQVAAKQLMRRKKQEKANHAATLIQSHYRRHCESMNYEFDLLSIIIVQNVFRQKVARLHVAEKKSERLNRSATFIQKEWRCYSSSKKYQQYLETKKIEQTRAATLIQSNWRRYNCSMTYFYTIADICIAQSIARRFLAIKLAKEHRSSRENEAAIKIQRVWRGFVKYADYMFLVTDVVLVQTKVRCWLAKRTLNTRRQERNIQNERNAATIQRNWKAAKRREIEKIRKSAATTIQRHWRGYWNFSNFLIMLDSSIRIQSVTRCYLASLRYQEKQRSVAILQARCRNRIENMKKERKDKVDKIIMNGTDFGASESHAAATVQKWVRGGQARFAYNLFLSVRLMQSSWRGYTARKCLSKHRAARAIQTCWRTKTTQDKYVIMIHQERCSTMIQSAWRGYVCFTNYKCDRSAVKIQNAWRGFICYTDYFFVLGDIVNSQRLVRSFLARKKYARLIVERQNEETRIRCESAVVIQSVWRCKHMRSRYIILRDNYVRERAATKIQSAWRGLLDYTDYIVTLSDVITVQKIVRGFMSRNEYARLLLEKDVIDIQRCYRGYKCRCALLEKARQDEIETLTKANELMLRRSATTIQRWWKATNEYIKIKKAALTIERFFIWVKIEVDQVIEKEQKRRKKKAEKKKLRKQDTEEEKSDHLAKEFENGRGKPQATEAEDAILDRIWENAVDEVEIDLMTLKSNRKGQGGEKKLDSSSRLPTTASWNDDDQSELSALTPNTIMFKAPSSRLNTLTASDLEEDFSLEEAWIDAEINSVRERRRTAGPEKSYTRSKLPATEEEGEI